MSSTDPAPPATPAGTGAVVVPLDRPAVDRVWRFAVSLQVLCVLLVLAVIVACLLLILSLDEPVVLFGLIPMLLPFGLLCYQVSVSLTVWRRLRSLGDPMVLDAEGIVLRSPFGTVRAPWAAVVSVNLERSLIGGRRIRVRLAAPREGQAVGGRWQWDLSTKRARRFVRRSGLVYALRILDIDPARLPEVFWTRSGGRVRVLGS